MRKKHIKLLSAILVSIFVLSMSTSVCAVNGRSSLYIAVQSGCLVRTSGSNFEIRYSVTGYETLDEIGVFMIQLTKSKDQVTWYRAEVFYSYDYPELVRQNALTHSGHITFTGEEGYYYRANIDFYGKENGDSERFAMYTNTIYIPYSANGGRAA